MKAFRIGTTLQLLFILGCLIALLCMLSASPLDPNALLSKIGIMASLLSIINPMGLIGTVIDLIACFATDVKNSKKAVIWAFVSPIPIALLWLLMTVVFVHTTGGV